MAAYGKNYTTAGSAMGRRKPDAFDEEIFGRGSGQASGMRGGPAAAGLSQTPGGRQSQANQAQGYQMPDPVRGFGGGGGGGSGNGQQDSGPPQTDDFTGDWQSDWRAYLASLGTQLTPRDTASEEALIQQNFEGLLGQGTNALAAQMGAAGFGQSGALMQAGSDLQGQLARQAAGQVNDVRRSAHQDYLNQLGLIGQMLQGGEQTGMSSEWYGNLMELIQAELAGGGDGGGGQPDLLGQAQGAARSWWDSMLGGQDQQGRNYAPGLDDADNMTRTDGYTGGAGTWQPGADAVPVGGEQAVPGWPNVQKFVAPDGQTYYIGSDGRMYRQATPLPGAGG